MLTLPTTIGQEEFKQDETAQVQSWGLVLEFWTGILKHWTQYNQKVSLCFNCFFPPEWSSGSGSENRRAEWSYLVKNPLWGNSPITSGTTSCLSQDSGETFSYKKVSAVMFVWQQRFILCFFFLLWFLFISEGTDFGLSLNGSESLTDTGQTLSSYGIVSGDLICVVLPESAAVATLTAPSAPAPTASNPPTMNSCCSESQVGDQSVTFIHHTYTHWQSIKSLQSESPTVRRKFSLRFYQKWNRWSLPTIH